MVFFWFGINSCFSGGNYYDSYYYMGYNTFTTVIPLAVYEILEQDFDPEFSSSDDKEKKYLKNLLPYIFKEYRDSLPFNLMKFIVVFLISIIFSYLCYMIPFYAFNNTCYGKNGYQFSFWDCSVVTYLSIGCIHYAIMCYDTSLFCPGIVLFYIIQLIVFLIFLLFCDKANSKTEIYNSLVFMFNNFYTWLTLIMTFIFPMLLFYIIRSAEFFFGDFIVNKIKLDKEHYKDIFIEKFYQKKIEQMTTVVRKVAKFKKIYYNKNNYEENTNLGDEKMKKMVGEFKIKKKNSFMKKNKSNISNIKSNE